VDRLHDTTALLSDLIGFPTVSVDSNLDMIAYLAERLDSVGAEVALDHSPCGRKANLFASLGGTGPGGIVLSGHTDVVPVTGQDWTSDPFTMVERDGHLIGRGTCDMKGFIAAAVAMAGDYAALPLKRPLHFAFTYDEETGCIGAQGLAEWLKAREIRPKLAIIGEPTLMRVIEGHKGCCEYTTRFHGLAGHGSMPDQGVNAAQVAMRYGARLMELAEDLKPRAAPDSPFDPPWTTINIGRIEGGFTPNVIPETCEMDWEFRPVQDSDFRFVKSEIADYADNVLLPQMRRVHPGARIETEVLGEVAGLEPTTVNEARDIVLDLTGGNRAEVVPFGTEAGIFAALGMDVVVCGPGSIAQAHKADEFIALDQLQACLTMLDGLKKRLV
jgi:acetylornithine deacetylase